MHLPTLQHFWLQIHLRQHCRSDTGLLSNVVSIRFTLCIFFNSRHKHTGDCYSFWMHNRTRTRVARIDYSLLDVSAGEQDFHKIHKALFFHFFGEGGTFTKAEGVGKNLPLRTFCMMVCNGLQQSKLSHFTICKQYFETKTCFLSQFILSFVSQ